MTESKSLNPPHLQASGDAALNIDKNYILAGKKITAEEHAKLFPPIPEYDYSTSPIPPPMEVSSLDVRVIPYLSRKAKKICKNKSMNTVYEYDDFKLFTVNGWYLTTRWHPPIYNIWTMPIKLVLSELFLYPILSYFARKLNTRRCTLVRFIVLGVPLKNSIDKNPYLEEYYVQQIAKLYNHLAKKGIIKYCQLAPVMLMKLANPERGAIALYVGAGKGMNNNDTMNEKAGIKVFSNEGNFIEDFDWSSIDKLK